MTDATLSGRAPVARVGGTGLARDVCAHVLSRHGFEVAELGEGLDPSGAVPVVVAAEDRSPSPAEPRKGDVELTPRELDIICSIDRGLAVKQAARELGVSTKTVENLQSRLFRKLQVRNRAQAVAKAHGLGILPRTFAGP